MVLILCTGRSLAQEEWEEAGEIEDAEVIIEKDRKIELPPANRVFKKVPPLEPNDDVDPQNYDFSEFIFPGVAYVPEQKARRLERSDNLTRPPNYVKVGFGNYISPLVDLSLNTSYNALSAGLSFSHLSFARGPVMGRESSSGDNLGALYARYNTKKVNFLLDLDFESIQRKHYGFSRQALNLSETDPNFDADPFKKSYNTFGLGLGFENGDANSAIDYGFRAGYYILDDNFNASENAFTLDLDISADIAEDIRIFTESDFLLSNYEDTGSMNRNIIAVKGGLIYQLDRLTITGAAKIALTNDTISNSNDFKIYPHAVVDYKIDEQWTVTGGLTGDLEAVTLRSLVNENPYLAPNLSLTHTNKQIDVFGRMNGSLNQNINVAAGASFANYENLYFFTDTLSFDLSYETDATNVFNVNASFNYDTPLGLSVNSRIDYYNYSTKTLDEAWHRPQFVGRVSPSYQVNDKLRIRSTLSLISGLKAFDPVSNGATNLDLIFDLSIGGDYQVNEKLGAFISIDNLISKQYERFINYINRGFMLHAGVTYSF